MRSVAVTNAKGGVGKSTTAINLSSALCDLDLKVLLVDADPSGNATLGLFPRGYPDAGLADVLLDQVALPDVILPTDVPGLSVIPPGNRLGSCSDQMGGSQGLGQGREFRIRRVLRSLTTKWEESFGQHFDCSGIAKEPDSVLPEDVVARMREWAEVAHFYHFTKEPFDA